MKHYQLGLKDGGIVKIAEGGMLDFGGKEMDLRGGGFVPIGKKKKQMTCQHDYLKTNL